MHAGHLQLIAFPQLTDGDCYLRVSSYSAGDKFGAFGAIFQGFWGSQVVNCRNACTNLTFGPSTQRIRACAL